MLPGVLAGMLARPLLLLPHHLFLLLLPVLQACQPRLLTCRPPAAVNASILDCYCLGRSFFGRLIAFAVNFGRLN